MAENREEPVAQATANNLEHVQEPTVVETQFVELVRAERDRAVALAYHMMGGDWAAAQDVAQEAFLKAHRALPGFRGEARLSTWLYRIVLQQARTANRRRWVRKRLARERASELESDLLGESRSGAGIGDPALRRRIATALERLSHRQRTAFALVHLEGFSTIDAAEVMGCAVGTLKSHLHRALGLLRQQLKELYVEQTNYDG